MSYNLLKGKRGIIFGALNEQSIAWKVAEKAVEEGATITLSNTPVAVRMGEVSALAEKLNCEVNFAIQFFGQCRNFTHTYSDRCIGQGDRCTFFYCFFCYFPGNGLLIQSTENNASFSFQQIVTHTYNIKVDGYLINKSTRKLLLLFASSSTCILSPRLLF